MKKIIKINFLKSITKDMPERKAGQFEGIIIGTMVTVGVLSFVLFLSYITRF